MACGGDGVIRGYWSSYENLHYVSWKDRYDERERDTVEANTFPVARPNPRAAGIAGDVNFIVEFWVIDYDFVGVNSEDGPYPISRTLNCCVVGSLEKSNLRLTES